MGLFFKKKKKEEVVVEKPAAPQMFNVNTSYKLLGINVEAVTPLAKKTEGFPFDYDTLKDIYDVGDKVYEYELYARIDRLALERDGDKFYVLLDGVKIGYISVKKTEEIQEIISKYGIRRLNLNMAFGHCQIVGRNDTPDKEMYGDNDDKWITSDYVDKPKGDIMIGYDKPWQSFGGAK